jgi:type II secretory ATPase GspE/PulE/Tfp pilus assembly ATPase PilB-like protein
MHHRYNSRDSALRMVRTAYSTLADPDSRADAFSEREYQNAMIERDYDRGRVRFRWASLPIFPDGCEVVLRLIPVGVKETHKTFEELGYDRHHEDMIRRIFARSVGITIIAGTTGSGKSTTLKHAIEGIASERKGTKIRTIEEPCEFVISGASQTPVVRPKDENTKKNPFVDAIKACMRADPDILMIGEIRDIETARLAIQAVRSGHQAMSTIHADSALTVVDRMVGMGIERDAIGSVGLISGLIYQKLVQVLCPKCRVPARKHAEERPNGTVERLLHMYGGDLPVSMYFKNPEGCPHCNGTGIVGRTVCAEVIRPTIEMTDCFRSGDSIGAYKLWRQDVAHANPFSVAGRSAFEHALIKAHQGICSPEDVEHAFEWLDDPQAMAWATPIREHAQSRRSSDERTARRNREGQAV